MALISEIFTSEKSVVSSYSSQRSSFQKAAHYIDGCGLSSLEYELMYSMLSGESWNPDIHEFIVSHISDSELILEFPERMLASLMKLNDQEFEEFAKKWGECDDVNVEFEAAKSLIRNLTSIARHAQAAKQHLYLWISS